MVMQYVCYKNVTPARSGNLHSDRSRVNYRHFKTPRKYLEIIYQRKHQKGNYMVLNRQL